MIRMFISLILIYSFSGCDDPVEVINPSHNSLTVEQLGSERAKELYHQFNSTGTSSIPIDTSEEAQAQQIDEMRKKLARLKNSPTQTENK